MMAHKFEQRKKSLQNFVFEKYLVTWKMFDTLLSERRNIYDYIYKLTLTLHKYVLFFYMHSKNLKNGRKFIKIIIAY